GLAGCVVGGARPVADVEDFEGVAQVLYMFAPAVQRPRAGLVLARASGAGAPGTIDVLEAWPGEPVGRPVGQLPLSHARAQGTQLGGDLLADRGIVPQRACARRASFALE